MRVTTNDVYRVLLELQGNEDPQDDYAINSVAVLSASQIAITYEQLGWSHLLGVVVTVHEDRDDEVARIVAGELGEPAGASADRLRFDANGVGWREERPLEWWYDGLTLAPPADDG